MSAVPFTPTPPIAPAVGETLEQYTAMASGKPYVASDPFLDRLRNRTAALLHQANATVDMAERMEIMRQFLACRARERGEGPGGPYIVQPFTCEYVSICECGQEQRARPLLAC